MTRSCYLCGKPADSKDHVPPKTLFPTPRPSNLITLPCCTECNLAHAKDEEYFRNNISMISDHRHAKDIWEATRRSYKRKPNILGNINGRISLVKYGSQFLPAVEFDGARTKRVVVKIARGLAFYHTRQRLPTEAKVEIYLDPIISEPFHELIRRLPFRNRWGTTFCYLGGMAPDEPNVGLWLLDFYVSKVFLVYFDIAS